jgi:hypothetical protein
MLHPLNDPGSERSVTVRRTLPTGFATPTARRIYPAITPVSLSDCRRPEISDTVRIATYRHFETRGVSADLEKYPRLPRVLFEEAIRCLESDKVAENPAFDVRQ